MAGVVPNAAAGFLNVALSNYMKEFRNNALVGDLIAPRVPVDRQSFQYVIFDRSNQRLDRQVLRAPGDTPQEDRFTYSTGNYTCKSHALRARVPFESEQYGLGLGFSTRQKATGRLTDKLSLAREAYIANLVYGGATNQIALAGTAMFDSYLTGGTSQPIEVVEAAKAQIRQAGVMPTHCIISDPVFVALQSNPTILARTIYKDNVGTTITLDILSTLFGLKCVLASAISLDKNDVALWVWQQGMVVCNVQDASSMFDLSALKTFVWTAAGSTVDGYGVLEFPDPDLDAKATIVSADWYWDTQITANETLVVISNCCAAPTMDAIAAEPVGF